ncbi:murein biosynthesis integral membrane protein MurJ [Roseivivax marinus]|uniref:murein biosynthesis integral membrane protein MurJ n=1 Tax=Roseivivax marinus TaxID=1379903 RepID=UPI0008AC4ABD|nr:murein biosynthesis integral membrane protein MurJ [Roseivivax marinus]UMA63911.1 murein biosynthesis integral membrane protein MurJ [Roseivivax marinus]SEL86402.1 putative peptidoglycan lipid II flippase [Roseivivax marinus]
MQPIRLLTGVLTVGVWTLLSRVLGLVREIVILALIGPGPVMDAFVAAFRLPNMFRRFFAEGAFNAAFVPMFSKRLEADDAPLDFGSSALSGLAFVLLIISALAMIFMPALVYATAEGFANDPRFALTVDFGRIVFPYILFISLAALLSGALNAAGRFAAAAAAPVLLNVLVISGMAIAAWLGGNVVLTLVWLIPVAGIAQLILVWVAAERAGLKLRPRRPRWTPEMKNLVRVAVPAALAGGVMQVNLLVGQQVASNFEKAVGWLYAADRLYQLPLGVVGIAVGIVLLPDLSRKLKAGDDAGGRAAFSRAAEISLALTLPSAVALVVIPLPIVAVLFQRGATSMADAAAIAQAVAIYGLGLPAFVLQKVLQPLFFAREDTKTPFRYAVVSMVVNAVLAIGLAPVLGWLAPAIATTVAGWALVALLLIGGRRLGPVARVDDRFRKRAWRIAAASVILGAVLWGTMFALEPLLNAGGMRYVALILLIAIGAAVYGLVGHAIGAFRLGDFREAVSRRRR